MNLSTSATMRAALAESFPDPCAYQLYAASPETGPAEYCDSDAELGTPYCLTHLVDDDPDRARDLAYDQHLDGAA